MKCVWLQAVPEGDWLCPRCQMWRDKHRERFSPEELRQNMMIETKQLKPFYSEADLVHYDVSSDPTFAEVCSFWLQFGINLSTLRLS